MSEVLAFKPPKHAKKLASTEMLVEMIKITPAMAARWLQQNTLNRPLRRLHVQFLAREMAEGRWKKTGESIKISIDEHILDGQHRLQACVDSGQPFWSLVCYGVERDAFDAIDTGAVRTPSDVLRLHYPERPLALIGCTAGAITWQYRVAEGWTNLWAKRRLSNQEYLVRAADTPELWRTSQIILEYPKSRLIPSTLGSALLYEMGQKSWAKADEYIRQVFTGEEISSKDPAWIVRDILIKDNARLSRMKAIHRGMLVVKGWNAYRRNRRPAARTLMVKVDETAPEIL